MQQTSSNSVSSVASVCSQGALWAALLADVQVCSGHEMEHGGETDPVSTGCSFCPTALLKRAAGEMAVGTALTAWRKVKGPLAEFPCQQVGIFTFPQSPAPILGGIMERGRQRFTTGHQKIAPLLGLLRWTQKCLFCKSQRFGRLHQSKVGCSVLSGSSSTLTLLYHPDKV